MPEQEFTFDVTQALLPNAFHRDGYVFNGWIDRTDWSRYEDQESIINLATENNTTIILYANWKAITYTIIFDANTGSGTMGNQLFTYNVSKALTSNSFTKRGYSFIGWNIERDGSGVSYQNGELIYRLTSVPDAEMTLYAQWEPVEYTISFDLNYAAELPDNIRIKLGDIIPELPIPERSGYTFKGWYTEDGQIIISGNEYTFDKDITLIAVWNKNASFNFVIIYIAGGASIILAVGITIPIVLRKKRLKKLSIGKNNNIN
jgi:uncharacterized repeat protein (TIGR02543 family)